MMKPNDITDINQARINAVKEYVNLHYGDELRLSELAALANLAPSSLCHIFKGCTGQTITDFIIGVRIQQAKDRLVNTQGMVKCIAYECGFSTLTNFNRLFKRFMGCTPTELRQQQKTLKV